MKVAHILPELVLGGVEQYVVDLSTEQVKLGHNVTVVSEGGAMEKLLPSEVKIIHAPVARKNLFTGMQAKRQLKSQWERDKPDIIHVHSRVPLWIGNWVGNALNIPVIMTCHSTYSKNFGIKPLRKIAAAICVSQTVADHLEGYLPHYVQVVRLGVNTQGKIQLPEAPRGEFLFVGRMTKLKGVDTLLQALAKVKGEFHLTLLGDGPKRAEWEELANQLGLQDKVSFRGARSQSEVLQAMSHAGLLLCPSTQEGYSLVRATAHRMGLPILASHIPVNRSMVRHATSLLTPGDVDEWAKGISDWLVGNRSGSDFCDEPVEFSETAIQTCQVYQDVIGRL